LPVEHYDPERQLIEYASGVEVCEHRRLEIGGCMR
jgi:hypothetical protein